MRRNNLFFMRLHKILMITIGILVEACLQIEVSTDQTSPTPTPSSVKPKRFPIIHIIGAVILSVVTVSGVLIILGYKYFKKRRKVRKDHEITPGLYSTDDGSEKSTIMQSPTVYIVPTELNERVTHTSNLNINVTPQHSATNLHYMNMSVTPRHPTTNLHYKNTSIKPWHSTTNLHYMNMSATPQHSATNLHTSIKPWHSTTNLHYMSVTPQHSATNLHYKNTSIKPWHSTTNLHYMSVTPQHSATNLHYMNINVTPRHLEIQQFPSAKSDYSGNNNIICQKTYHDNDSDLIRGSHCILYSSDHTYDGHYDHYIILFSLNGIQNNLSLSHPFLLDNVSHNLSRNTPSELYIDKLSITGQGAIGLKFQAKKGFRIVLNSNTNQSYGSNVIVLDIGEDVTYFRKRNNDDPSDILASIKEQKALLDKDIEQLYWFSLDKKNRRLRYGKGPMQSFRAVFYYNFPPQSSQGIDEYEWIENLRYIAISDITFQKKDFIENKSRIELISCNLPVTTDLPPVIVKREDATLEELETGNVTVIDNLPEECKDLYWNVVGTKITLNSPDFPDFADAIEYSIKTPGLTCYEKLKEKASGFGGHNPKKTYLRITLGEDRGNSPGVPYVLEIWPSGHYSPIHSHSNSFAIIKVLHNEIVSRYFSDLQPKDQEWYYEVTLKEGQITWISDKFYQTHQLWNRTRKVCVTIQCYQYGDKNREHYEYFDYIDNKNIVKQFKPNTDWPFAEFKRLIRKEWNRYKYLSTELKT